MSTKRRTLLLAGVAGLVAGLLGIASAVWLQAPPTRTGADPDGSREAPAVTAKTIIGQPRPAFSLPDNTGVPRSVTEWDGKVLLINFWGTWCAPCRDEIPILIDLQQIYGPRGYATVGIALDSSAAVTDFLAAFGVNYPSLVGEQDVIALGRAYGNAVGVLPFSVLVDRHGIVRYAHLGLIERAPLEERIAGLL